ncbi:hypothetical protein TRAPUB_12242 [Trametes pubescens]|uniref:Uncharacterized protein n=1 Tax=Trametes pubescens TaxID=154538 RepID=A0A1M2VUN7_TRAPU|nr:hypothetical protein TRAPUB_12242 [Trametes pubescens]
MADVPTSCGTRASSSQVSSASSSQTSSASSSQASSSQASSSQASSSQASSSQVSSAQVSSSRASLSQASSPQASSPQASSPQASSPQASSPQASSSQASSSEGVSREVAITYPPAAYVPSEAELLAITDWEPFLSSREKRGGVGQTVWYQTCGPFILSQPPANLSADVDDLYLHRDVGTSRSKMWVLNSASIWVAVRAGDAQPSDPSRRLSISKSGDPSWVTRASYSVYRSRTKRARRLGQGFGPTA